MTMTDALDRARDCFARHAWAEAHAQLAALDQGSPLAPADLERLAIAAFLAAGTTTASGRGRGHSRAGSARATCRGPPAARSG
jgi:hypothetical protein